MAQLSEHPSVKHFYQERANRGEVPADQVLDAAWLRQLCLDAGADDVGFVERDRPEIADQRAEIEEVFPKTKTLISVVCRMNRENIRTPARSISNLEFHHTTDETNEVARRIVSALEEVGISAINGGAVGFPMEADRWGSKMWVISHKPVAVAAGLGQMGIHRNVIHPKFGNFILLGTVLVDAEVSEYSHPLVYNPAWNASYALPPARQVRSAQTVSSISPPATPTITASSWADSVIGWRRSRIAKAHTIIVRMSQGLRRSPCGRACRSAPTTRPLIAWRYALRVRT